MHENSRTGETSENVENSDGKPNKTEDVSDYLQRQNILVGAKCDAGSGPSGNQVPDCPESIIDASGPSSYLPPPLYRENEEDREENNSLSRSDRASEDNDTMSPISQAPSYEADGVYVPRVRMAPEVEIQQASRNPIMGPPPSYSFVMKQKRKVPKTINTSETFLTTRPLPPTYSGGIRRFPDPPENMSIERNFILPSFTEPVWRSHSQPALCPRCGILIITTTHSHDSVATHVAALALCLFGCWPCCLLPYCMNICKNTYHYCPLCQVFLGAYAPW